MVDKSNLRNICIDPKDPVTFMNTWGHFEWVPRKHHNQHQHRRKAWILNTEHTAENTLLSTPLVICWFCYPASMLCSCYINRWYRTTGPAVTERFGSFMKGGTPNGQRTLFCRDLRPFWKAFTGLSTKAILLSKSFQWKQCCFRRAFNESHPAFVDLSTKAILLL